MTVSVLQYVSQAFNELGASRPSGSAGSLEEIDQDSLGLVDNADLEQQVAIDNLTNRLRNQYQEWCGCWRRGCAIWPRPGSGR